MLDSEVLQNERLAEVQYRKMRCKIGPNSRRNISKYMKNAYYQYFFTAFLKTFKYGIFNTKICVILPKPYDII